MDEFDIEPTEPGAGFALTDGQKYAILALGGLAFVAILLSVAARRRGVLGSGAGGYSLATDAAFVGSDWQASMRHFAGAVDNRFQGIEQQLQSIHQAVGTTPTADTPSPFVPNSNGLGRAVNLTYEQATADQDENIPPGPASVGLPK